MQISKIAVKEFNSVVKDFSEYSRTETNDSIQTLKNNQLSAIESLALLLLREIELLKKNEGRINNQKISGRRFNLYEETQNFEAAMIRSALIQTGGNQRKAAELLGLKVTTLNVKIKRYKIDFIPPDFNEI